ncbi:PREDICTED: protein SFI1 homolog isoform X2 [Amphimedon queenslandica]|uniref:Sfi1 spindle body domain-containing protein n=1 Tax=Amphimedon queenslandica TaxID=400682 RepID=A0AAN0K517_AMPQE|nr:PREDICTED: protein SFI1 homolog isoform X2 [Amphimedon queenslandica]|eukprot:XP_019864396.1 PREDICTED: protein SFI1 homolog isoform X2 [Amphimedon queenslandica]
MEKKGGKKVSSKNSKTSSHSSLYLYGSASRLGPSPLSSAGLPSSSLASRPAPSTERKRRRHEETLGKTFVIKTSKLKNSPRIKYLTRKYSQIWSKKTFGRVSPLVARQHYRTRLLRKIIMGWKEVWWEGHREWKLMIRAECHDRYRLWGRGWKGWRRFVESKKEGRLEMRKAKDFEFKKLLKCHYSLWNKRLKENKDLSLLALKAESFHHTTMKRRVLSSWKDWKRTCDMKKEKTDIASLHYNKQLVNKYYCRWVYMSQSVSMATNHQRLKLLMMVVMKWREYVDTRHDKLNEKDKAVLFYKRLLLNHYFRYWKNSLQQEMKCQDYQYQRTTCVLKRIIKAWKSRITYRHSKNDRLLMATSYYNIKLKRAGIKGLQNYHRSQLHSRALHNKAMKHNILICLRMSWLKWIGRCEQSEDIKLYPMTKKAREHHCIKVYVYYWKRWRVYIEYKKFRGAQLVRAMRHYNSKILPIYFGALKNNVTRCRTKRDMILSSEEFRERILISQYFYQWLKVYGLKIEERESISVAVEYSQERLLKRFLGTWRKKLLTLYSVAKLETVAQAHQKHQVLSNSLRKWRNKLLSVQKSESHYDRRLLKWVWSNWREYLASKKEVRSVYNVAVQFWCLSVLRRCMGAWKSYCSISKMKRANILIANEHYHKILASNTLHDWKVNVDNIRRRRRLLTMSLVHRHKTLLIAHWRIWRQSVIRRLEEKAVAQSKVTVLRTALDHIILRDVFVVWLKHAQDRRSYRVMRDKGHKFKRRRLLAVSFKGWLSHHSTQVKQRELTRKGDYFNKTRLISSHYLKWRVQFMETLVNRHQTTLSLYHWGRTLERKLLRIWHFYAKEKKRQRGRYLVAMETYRSHLLVSGVTQWIEVASVMKANRCSIAMKQNIESNSKLWETVRRCASHWRRLTNQNRGKENVGALPSNVPSHHDNHQVPKYGSHSVNKRSAPVGDWNNLMSEIKIPLINTRRPHPRCPTYLTTPSFNTKPLPVVHSKLHLPAPPTKSLKPHPSSSDSVVPLSFEPHPSSPPTRTNSDMFLSISTESGFHSDRKPHPSSDPALLLPIQCQLLPPSAFTSKRNICYVKKM